MITLTVELAERSYPIYIGSGLSATPELLTRHIRGKQVMIVTNTTVAPLYLDMVRQMLDGYQVDSVVLPDGEQYKNLETLNLIFDALLEQGHNRTTTLLALGGGVIGDMCGYAAASYQRGVDFIQMPTTLLSQVDSSVGGKTGVNHRLGKNMIGAFYQPQAVLIDTDTLTTLPSREVSAGMAEVIKYGLLEDVEFYHWIQQHVDGLMAGDGALLAQAIHTSCACKARVVAQDEREGGIRAILNLGHTFGHAIESHQGYGQWLHGEAVGTGLLMAADLSCRMGAISSADVAELKALLIRSSLPVLPPENMSEEDFLSRMSLDKKVLDGRIRLVLLRRIGQAYITSDIDRTQLCQTLAMAALNG
ncbi:MULTISPECIES: 3-dehydroquinate synthase [unclassified Oceanobacter]|jgi:3-dehydroquinate synthase|uniref:3-dehydroquinate synthase n=1 Tax=unclassified Oceanobacter TaxID=2620260 RepID=UPI0026E3E223|nr:MULTISPECIES: 3-dehydroquinate synthase [unclassified Oceanobacter]MDO6682850.1 3-dehydroquinate synthase [Oceanobacter sp. 5_MG-2023]MDP2505609.1 3-dehydroquinate synthase [Oceanobacter sp. 3_MG-2023]MDP2547191.1 3-dehydroquinate synthase [Oceanobacter sp. 4_MG-2023]MDP2609390.1 3-dehydroquinate synthase [Oceanobacter sp. 1_MG-2023]MDP2612773.1 3-dehydroquinate synthase [Oceanobacter sp. 2_MG-2023]